MSSVTAKSDTVKDPSAMNHIPDELMKTAQEWCLNAKAPMVFSGAGLSVESGISAFRTKDGLWKQVDVEKYATPQGFKDNPQAVRDWYWDCLLYTSPSPRDRNVSRMPSSA